MPKGVYERTKEMYLTRIGKTRSKKARKKMSLAHMGKILTEEHKRNISLANIGKIKYKRVPSPYSELKDDCWICTTHCENIRGYPYVRRNSKKYLMSRYIYEKVIGEIPEGMLVCHKCDRPNCINPDHLFLGTQKDNVQDMLRKGRGKYQYA